MVTRRAETVKRAQVLAASIRGAGPEAVARVIEGQRLVIRQIDEGVGPQGQPLGRLGPRKAARDRLYAETLIAALEES